MKNVEGNMKRIEANISLVDLQEIAKDLTENQILVNLVPLFALKRRPEQNIRDLSSEILDNISSEGLADCYQYLIDLIRAPYAFVRSEAERLINKISPELLFDKFDNLLNLRTDADFGVKRFAKASVLKIAAAWPIQEKKLQYSLILEWQQSGDEHTVKVANFLALQVMETWKVDDLKLFMPFLVECSDLEKNDFETSELAASLAFKFLSVSGLSAHLKNLDYMTQFNEYGNKELRRGFRHMALQTLNLVNPDEYSKYGLFLFKCLEGKNKEDRLSAWDKLLKVDPDKLPVCELVYCQVCGLYRVRHAGKELANKVSDDVLLINLEELLLMQDSDCYEVRCLAMKLAAKIPFKKRATKNDILRNYLDSRITGISDLARCLLNG